MEDGGAGSYLAEALIMPSVGPGTDKGRIWREDRGFVLHKLVYVVSDKKESLLVIPRLVSDTGLRVLFRVAKIDKS